VNDQAAKLTRILRRRSAKSAKPKPVSISAQLAGSGTALKIGDASVNPRLSAERQARLIVEAIMDAPPQATVRRVQRRRIEVGPASIVAGDRQAEADTRPEIRIENRGRCSSDRRVRGEIGRMRRGDDVWQPRAVPERSTDCWR